MTLPALVALADWSVHPDKRFVARARLSRGEYRLSAPQKVGDPVSFIARLREETEGAPVLAGFDFPIGLPAGWTPDFRSFLQSDLADFCRPAALPCEISRRRPFYPARCGARGEHTRDHLKTALGTGGKRECDQLAGAEALFWLVGPRQVGKAAIHGWMHVLRPALERIFLWPFDGTVAEGLESGRVVVVEAYPRLCARILGLQVRNKRDSDSRREASAALAHHSMDPALKRMLASGFGPHAAGEDAFDAVIGLCGILRVLATQSDIEPPDRARRCEGWIFGLPASTPAPLMHSV